MYIKNNCSVSNERPNKLIINSDPRYLFPIMYSFHIQKSESLNISTKFTPSENPYSTQTKFGYRNTFTLSKTFVSSKTSKSKKKRRISTFTTSLKNSKKSHSPSINFNLMTLKDISDLEQHLLSETPTAFQRK
jgi:hypothetical protein